MSNGWSGDGGDVINGDVINTDDVIDTGVIKSGGVINTWGDEHSEQRYAVNAGHMPTPDDAPAPNNDTGLPAGNRATDEPERLRSLAGDSLRALRRSRWRQCQAAEQSGATDDEIVRLRRIRDQVASTLEPAIPTSQMLISAEALRDAVSGFPTNLSPLEMTWLNQAIGLLRQSLGLDPLSPAQVSEIDSASDTVAVRLYLGTDTNVDKVEQALSEVLDSVGLAVTGWNPPVQRSWFRLVWTKVRAGAESDLTARLMRELDRAVELRAVDEVQARVDAAQGDAVAKLITSLAETRDALIQIGSVLLVKVNGVPAVRNLTQAELAYLQRNPELFRSPALCLERLQLVSDEAKPTGTSGQLSSVSDG